MISNQHNSAEKLIIKWSKETSPEEIISNEQRLNSQSFMGNLHMFRSITSTVWILHTATSVQKEKQNEMACKINVRKQECSLQPPTRFKEDKLQHNILKVSFKLSRIRQSTLDRQLQYESSPILLIPVHTYQRLKCNINLRLTDVYEAGQ